MSPEQISLTLRFYSMQLMFLCSVRGTRILISPNVVPSVSGFSDDATFRCMDDASEEYILPLSIMEVSGLSDSFISNGNVSAQSEMNTSELRQSTSHSNSNISGILSRSNATMAISKRDRFISENEDI